MEAGKRREIRADPFRALEKTREKWSVHSAGAPVHTRTSTATTPPPPYETQPQPTMVIKAKARDFLWVVVTSGFIVSVSVVEGQTSSPARINDKTMRLKDHHQQPESVQNNIEPSTSKEYLKTDALMSPYPTYNPNRFYPYGLPECTAQQVCNAIYIRFNATLPLCRCPDTECPTAKSSIDYHSYELLTPRIKKSLTLVKTCEPLSAIRACEKPRDWAILALQNVRTRKAHYLVVCRCDPANGVLDGPVEHDQPSYAQVPGIRIYGMLCTQTRFYRRAKAFTLPGEHQSMPDLPMERIRQFLDGLGSV